MTNSYVIVTSNQLKKVTSTFRQFSSMMSHQRSRTLNSHAAIKIAGSAIELDKCLKRATNITHITPTKCQHQMILLDQVVDETEKKISVTSENNAKIIHDPPNKLYGSKSDDKNNHRVKVFNSKSKHTEDSSTTKFTYPRLENVPYDKIKICNSEPGIYRESDPKLCYSQNNIKRCTPKNTKTCYPKVDIRRCTPRKFRDSDPKPRYPHIDISLCTPRKYRDTEPKPCYPRVDIRLCTPRKYFEPDSKPCYPKVCISHSTQSRYRDPEPMLPYPKVMNVCEPKRIYAPDAVKINYPQIVLNHSIPKRKYAESVPICYPKIKLSNGKPRIAFNPNLEKISYPQIKIFSFNSDNHKESKNLEPGKI